MFGSKFSIISLERHIYSNSSSNPISMHIIFIYTGMHTHIYIKQLLNKEHVYIKLIAPYETRDVHRHTKYTLQHNIQLYQIWVNNIQLINQYIPTILACFCLEKCNGSIVLPNIQLIRLSGTKHSWPTHPYWCSQEPPF